MQEIVFDIESEIHTLSRISDDNGVFRFVHSWSELVPAYGNDFFSPAVWRDNEDRFYLGFINARKENLVFTHLPLVVEEAEVPKLRTFANAAAAHAADWSYRNKQALPLTI